MEGVLYAADSVYSLLFLGAGVLAALQSRGDLLIARRLTIIGAAVMTARWGAWALATDASWPIRTLAGAIVGGALFALLPAALHWISDRNNESQKEIPAAVAARPDVIFPKIAFFWVNNESNIYDLGLSIKLFNADTRAYTLNGISFSAADFAPIARGTWYVERLTIWPDHGQAIEDRYIKAGSEGYYKILLHFQTRLNPGNGLPTNSGPPPGVLLRAKWTIVFGTQTIELSPEFHATYESLMTKAEWADLGHPASKIDMNNLHYQPF